MFVVDRERPRVEVVGEEEEDTLSKKDCPRGTLHRYGTNTTRLFSVPLGRTIYQRDGTTGCSV